MSEPTTKICAACGAEIANDAAEGLCVACLLQQAAFESEAGSAKNDSSPTVQAIQAAFPQLEILEKVGRGGMGTVFKARQPKLDRFVALKILSPSSPHLAATAAHFSARFAREGKLLAKLSHPNIVTVYDFGQADGFYYLIMEFVEGVNLRQAMREERFTPEQALAIVPKICEALQYAHDEGVLHRDIKPENILLDAKGRVKIADFGIGKLTNTQIRAGSVSDRLSPEIPEAKNITQTGQVLGTPSYMAPEQREDPNRVDHRADIYSLGVVFYELLTGELPKGRFPLPSEKTPVDADIDAIVLKALEREREKRFQSAGELKTEIETATQNHNVATDELNAPIRAFQSFIKNKIHRHVLPFAVKYKFLILGFVTCMCIFGLVTERNIGDQIVITILLGGSVFYWIALLFFGKNDTKPDKQPSSVGERKTEIETATQSAQLDNAKASNGFIKCVLLFCVLSAVFYALCMRGLSFADSVFAKPIAYYGVTTGLFIAAIMSILFVREVRVKFLPPKESPTAYIRWGYSALGMVLLTLGFSLVTGLAIDSVEAIDARESSRIIGLEKYRSSEHWEERDAILAAKKREFAFIRNYSIFPAGAIIVSLSILTVAFQVFDWMHLFRIRKTPEKPGVIPAMLIALPIPIVLLWVIPPVCLAFPFMAVRWGPFGSTAFLVQQITVSVMLVIGAALGCVLVYKTLRLFFKWYFTPVS